MKNAGPVVLLLRACSSDFVVDRSLQRLAGIPKKRRIDISDATATNKKYDCCSEFRSLTRFTNHSRNLLLMSVIALRFG
jgi:hypothetical protein